MYFKCQAENDILMGTKNKYPFTIGPYVSY